MNRESTIGRTVGAAAVMCLDLFAQAETLIPWGGRMGAEGQVLRFAPGRLRRKPAGKWQDLTLCLRHLVKVA